MLGTKEDFELIRQQVNIEAVAGMLMRRQGRAYIYPGERTGSVYIYPKTNTFYDFGRAVGGDVIRLWSHIKGCNSWTALKEITETFGLNLPDRKDPALIKQQEQARQVRLKAEQAEKRRWRLPEITTYKGEVTRMSDLPLAPEIGDFYKIGSRTLFYNDGWNELA